MHPGIRSRIGPVVLALATLVLLGGCATGHSLGNPASGSIPGGAGGFPERTEDPFQIVQEASGLGEEARHPVGAALYLEQARELLGRVAKTRVTTKSFAPRRVLFWLLGEVLEGGERVEYAELRRRTRRFASLVLVRPDGYLVAALTGEPLQRMGQVTLEEGQWKVGRLAVGEFYFSRGGVLYPVNDVLRRADTPPWAELGLKRDWLNAALDGAQDAMGEMAVALARTVLHPIRTVEDLGQLPTTVALLIASSPEYFARYGAMSHGDQLREAARLSTHVLMLLGGAEVTVGRMGGLGAELPVVSLTARGELALSRVVVSGGTVTTTLGVELGALSILHMASSGQGNSGGGDAKEGQSSQTPPRPGPGRWTYKTPTTESEDALDYQEQVTGQPAWRVYLIDGMEFDSFTGKELLEAKGPGYKQFLEKDGTLKPWFEGGKGFQGLMEQARKQSRIAKTLKLPLIWHVAEPEFASFLRQRFRREGWDNIDVRDTSLKR
ncbi:Tox-REase-5 domain-containing protein [Archangium sp.]|uniref:Tox-REase-5 domain-containing protein n=1 Tax=Archangium sp. TaxID=1872627 RepID=UPI00389A6D8A